MSIVNVTYPALEMRRITRDIPTLFFTAILPGFFYLIFGAAQDYGSERVGNGNVAMMIMITMAAYGAVTATTGIGGMAAIERMQGWGRQLGLTPLSDRGYVAIKATVAIAIALIPVGLVYLLGVLTGAEGTARAWLLSALIVVAGSTVFALYGLCFGLALRSEAAVSAAGGSVVILAFMGNVFFPLSGTLLAIAKFTPLYGYVALAKYPMTEGWMVDGSGGGLIQEALWVPVANVVGWTLILAVAATLLVRRGRARQ